MCQFESQERGRRGTMCYNQIHRTHFSCKLIRGRVPCSQATFEVLKLAHFDAARYKSGRITPKRKTQNGKVSVKNAIALGQKSSGEKLLEEDRTEMGEGQNQPNW